MPRLTAKFIEEFQEIRIEEQEHGVYFWIALASAADTTDAEEVCRLRDATVATTDNGWRAEVLWESSIWKRKTHVYEYMDGRLDHWIELEGEGRLKQLTYLSGTVGDEVRGSVPGFGAVYVACPNFLDRPYCHPAEFTGMSASNLTEVWGSAFNTGPLMFAFGEHGQSGWLAAGLEVERGRHTFQTLGWNMPRGAVAAHHDSIVGTQCIGLDYLGAEQVSGTWRSPTLVFLAGKDPLSCARTYCDGLYAKGLAKSAGHPRAAWWDAPILCTWHEQVALGCMEMQAMPVDRRGMEGGDLHFKQITAERVSHWLDLLDRHDIHPGTVILDAMWQADTTRNEPDPAKFPDLRGFIDTQHAAGRHVMLWMQAWRHEGLPAEWCIMHNREPVMADPTHPEYRAFATEMVRRMLGDHEGGYNGDGLKIDGTNQLPGGLGITNHDGIFGMELLHTYLKLMYDAAKAAKPDALVSIYSANPYLADCCDMVRLGDLYTVRGDPRHTMHWRTDLARIGLPHAVIDNDGAYRFSLRDDIAELSRHQIEIGVPCIYQAEYLVQRRIFVPSRVRKLTDDDYAAIRTAWAEYESRRRGRSGRAAG